MNDCVVVDASQALKWVLKEPYAEEVMALASEWAAAKIRPVAPCLILVEVTNVLYRRAMLGHISFAQSRQLLVGLLNMGIEVRESSHIHFRALELAQELKRPAVYDTHYLALADRQLVYCLIN